MRVFVARATGAIGRPLVRQLVEAGHEVTGMRRVPDRSNAKAKAELGWEPRYPSWRQGFREALG